MINALFKLDEFNVLFLIINRFPSQSFSDILGPSLSVALLLNRPSSRPLSCSLTLSFAFLLDHSLSLSLSTEWLQFT